MKRPTYTLPSIIKKVFRPGERSLPRNEVINRMEESILGTTYDLESEAILVEVLRMEQSPVQVERSDAIIELTYQPHQLFDMAYRFLRDTHAPKMVEQIVPELRRQSQFSWNQVTRMLQLERDPRFVQYIGDQRWFLTEWKLANEEMYAFLQKNNIFQLSTRSISHVMEQEAGLSLTEYVFLPVLDDRFRLGGDVLYVVQQQTFIADTQATTEVAAATDTYELDEQLSFKEEPHVNHTEQTQPVLHEVHQYLLQALARLEVRNQEMSQDVISYFQQSNMQAIEVLMKEKHKNEQISLGIQQVLAACEQ